MFEGKLFVGDRASEYFGLSADALNEFLRVCACLYRYEEPFCTRDVWLIAFAPPPTLRVSRKLEKLCLMVALKEFFIFEW
jgi:hypothetical protein